MELYLVSTDDGNYKLLPSEKKRTMKDVLSEKVNNMKDGKIKSTLEGYVTKMEDKEESTLKMVYSLQDVELHYSNYISEDDAKKECKDLYDTYFKKNFWPMLGYGVACPITLVLAPFVPLISFPIPLFFFYKFISKYKTMRSYNKILKSGFVKDEKCDDLETLVNSLSKEKKS